MSEEMKILVTEDLLPPSLVVHEELHQVCTARRLSGAALSLVGACCDFQSEVDAKPAKGFRFPSSGIVSDPRKVHEIGIPFKDEIAQSPSREVGHRHTIAYVPPTPGKTRAPVQADRAEPVARNAERASPTVRDPCVACCGKEVDQDARQIIEHSRLPIEAVIDARSEMIGSAATAERDAIV
jgi:hypothetical protein